MTTSEEAIELIEQRHQEKELSLREAMERYDLVSAVSDPVNGSFVVLAERPTSVGDVVPRRDDIYGLGATSPSPWTSWTRDERVPELYEKRGTRTYYDMKRADGTVRGALRMLKTPILAARWFIEPHGRQSDEPTTVDKNIAHFIEHNLFENLNVPWSRVVEEALTMCEYGYSMMEVVWDICSWDSSKIMVSKLSPRHPLDVREFIFDSFGSIRGVMMEGTEANGFEPTFIPIEKLIIFTLEQEGGDLRGTSVLRSAYKHYYYKDTLYKIDAIQKERHGIGVPIIKLPMGFTTEDKRLAEELGRNLRTNERAHITIPMNWEILFAKLEGQPVDCIASIDHHDKKILSNVLAPFLDDSNAKTDSMDMFLKSTRYIANTIADTINKFLIPKIVRVNFLRGNIPHLHARRIGEWEDMRTMSFTLRNLVGAKLITPDQRLEEQLRRELDVPAMDMATLREVDTPQMPGGGGGDGDGEGPESPKPSPAQLPRQSPKAPVGTPAKNAGKDASGGK